MTKRFFIIYSNKSQKPASKELNNDHVSFLKEIEKEKKLLFYSLLKEKDNAILIIKEVSREKVLDIIYRDPFIQTKLYKNFKLSEITETNSEENILLSSATE